MCMDFVLSLLVYSHPLCSRHVCCHLMCNVNRILVKLQELFACRLCISVFHCSELDEYFTCVGSRQFCEGAWANTGSEYATSEVSWV